jgi:tetratricopeptide (TPR) repeat protein
MGEYEEAIPHLRILDEILDAKKEWDPLPALYLGYAYLKCNAHEECEKRLRDLIDKLKILEPNFKDRFYGREYGEHRHFNEVMARAYIYLAYSYVERGANLYDAWKLAFNSKHFIDGMVNDKKDYKSSSHDISSVNVSYDIINEFAGEISYKAGEISLAIDNLGASISLQTDGAPAEAVKPPAYCIDIVFDKDDWYRKRKAKAHLAECAGAICYKAGKIDEAVDYLNASIALYPDSGAYLNMAKAKERKIICGDVSESKKALIWREIQELCLHVKALDIRDEHKIELEEFEKHMPGKENESKNPADVKPPGKEV